MRESDLRADAQALCAADELAERGRAIGFDVMLWRQPARAFALRFDGRVVAYINRCAHVPAEMDWQPGEFLDAHKRHIVCSMHGAMYDVPSGRCIGGPCGKTPLVKLRVEERGGSVYYLGSEDD